MTEFNDLVGQHFDDLSSPIEGESKYPRVYATLKIDASLLTKEQMHRVMEARSILQEVGVGFDTGVGAGAIDWELDWSLRGAWIVARHVSCAFCREPVNGEAVWVSSEHYIDGISAPIGESYDPVGGHQEIYDPNFEPYWNRGLHAFCSMEHVNAERERWEQSGQPYRIIVIETAPVGLEQ